MNVSYTAQGFNLKPTSESTVRIESADSALGLHAKRKATDVGCSIRTDNPMDTQPLATSSNWAIFRSKEITESQLSPDDLLQSEWFLTAQFVPKVWRRVTIYDDVDPNTAMRMLTAKSSTSDDVEALLVLEDIKGLETIREQQNKLASMRYSLQYNTNAQAESAPSFNTWKFICDESKLIQ